MILNGKHHYLGAYDSPESHQRYEQLIAEWILSDGDLTKFDLSVSELCLLFAEHAVEHYRRKDGSATGTIRNVREALRYLVDLFGKTPAKDFGPRKLKAVRDAIIKDGRVRTNTNRLIHWIRRSFRWGVENEYVSVNVYSALQTVTALQPGRSKATESEPVNPVPMDVVIQTVPHLTSVVGAMVRLQLLTGARPVEVISMRPSGLEDRSERLAAHSRPRNTEPHCAHNGHLLPK